MFRVPCLFCIQADMSVGQPWPACFGNAETARAPRAPESQRNDSRGLLGFLDCIIGCKRGQPAVECFTKRSAALTTSAFRKEGHGGMMNMLKAESGLVQCQTTARISVPLPISASKNNSCTGCGSWTYQRACSAPH